MGLESHITRELQRAKSGFVEGEDYFFNNGLHTSRKIVAHEICELLDATGEFGATTVSEDATGFRVNFKRWHDDMKPIPVLPGEWGVK